MLFKEKGKCLLFVGAGAAGGQLREEMEEGM
jgi:hypothetical protein